jgi:GTP-binding protein
LRIAAEFVTSAATAADFPGDLRREIALVGRSNVGKSSLINALVRQRVARTSGAPGKTRLANIYRVARGSAPPLYLVDLPGYGYARGDVDELEAVTRAYFGRVGQALPDPPGSRAALLLVDSRHPGLLRDIEAWRWLRSEVERFGIVATKIDKLSRAERTRALKQLESVFESPVLPVSAVTGEGLDELWTLIEHLTNSNNKRAETEPQPPPTKALPPRTRTPPPQTEAPQPLRKARRLPKKAPRLRKE